MNKKEEFKLFVKNHPELISYVNSNQMTWQKFYEMYVLYDSDSEVWKKYFSKSEETISQNTKVPEKLSFNEFISMVKRIDLDSVQKNINSINKGLALIESLVGNKEVSQTSGYNPRPLYKKFED